MHVNRLWGDVLRGSELYSVYLPKMKGEPEFCMCKDELVEEFNVLTRTLLRKARAESILNISDSLETANDIAPLLAACWAMHLISRIKQMRMANSNVP